MVKYVVEGNRAGATEVSFAPIEFLGWDCLTVGALGWGQIQIANSNFIRMHHGYSRKEWMLNLCEIMFDFYPKEIQKIQERIGRFREVKRHWEQKTDIWI